MVMLKTVYCRLLIILQLHLAWQKGGFGFANLDCENLHLEITADFAGGKMRVAYLIGALLTIAHSVAFAARPITLQREEFLNRNGMTIYCLDWNQQPPLEAENFIYLKSNMRRTCEFIFTTNENGEQGIATLEQTLPASRHEKSSRPDLDALERDREERARNEREVHSDDSQERRIFIPFKWQF